MRKLTATLCLTIAVLLGSAGVSASADFQKGLTAYKSGDYATALRKRKPLAKQEHSKSQYNLGVMYANGQGVPKNKKTAVKWYRLAAEQGNARAQGNLGANYALGKGVLKDFVRAYMWGNINATNGNKRSVKLQNFVAKRMNSAQIAEAKKLARECVRKNYKEC